MRSFILNIFFLLASTGFATSPALAQELNCRVNVVANQIETTERRVFDEMQTAFAKFMNDRRWTDETFENQQRIKCDINITLQSQASIGVFSANAQIVLGRPVYYSSYEATLLNFADRDFDFEYTESQPLDFQLNNFLNNITSLLGYYAYMMLGYTYDSFGALAGQPYYEKAWEVVNNSQPSGSSGWEQFKSVRNRYWLTENALNKVMEPLRQAIYEYHIQGLDLMAEKPEEGRKNILEALKKIQQVNQARPRAIMVISFLDAKTDEIVSLFSQGDLALRREAYSILVEMNPAQTEKFSKILAQ